MKLIGFYDHYEYEEYPLAFIPLHNLTDTQKVSLLQQLDTLYGDTDQDTPDYALEYQVIVRMLLHEGWFPVNTKYLALPECMDQLRPILGSENSRLLEKAMEPEPEEISRQYNDQEK